jgi:hypothetical protein
VVLVGDGTAASKKEATTALRSTPASRPEPRVHPESREAVHIGRPLWFLSESRMRQMRRRALPSACGDRHGHEMRGVAGFDAHQDRVLARRARLLEGLTHV